MIVPVCALRNADIIPLTQGCVVGEARPLDLCTSEMAPSAFSSVECA